MLYSESDTSREVSSRILAVAANACEREHLSHTVEETRNVVDRSSHHVHVLLSDIRILLEELSHANRQSSRLQESFTVLDAMHRSLLRHLSTDDESRSRVHHSDTENAENTGEGDEEDEDEDEDEEGDHARSRGGESDRAMNDLEEETRIVITYEELHALLESLLVMRREEESVRVDAATSRSRLALIREILAPPLDMRDALPSLSNGHNNMPSMVSSREVHDPISGVWKDFDVSCSRLIEAMRVLNVDSALSDSLLSYFDLMFERMIDANDTERSVHEHRVSLEARRQCVEMECAAKVLTTIDTNRVNSEDAFVTVQTVGQISQKASSFLAEHGKENDDQLIESEERLREMLECVDDARVLANTLVEKSKELLLEVHSTKSSCGDGNREIEDARLRLTEIHHQLCSRLLDFDREQHALDHDRAILAAYESGTLDESDLGMRLAQLQIEKQDLEEEVLSAEASMPSRSLDDPLPPIESIAHLESEIVAVESALRGLQSEEFGPLRGSLLVDEVVHTLHSEDSLRSAFRDNDIVLSDCKFIEKGSLDTLSDVRDEFLIRARWRGSLSLSVLLVCLDVNGVYLGTLGHHVFDEVQIPLSLPSDSRFHSCLRSSSTDFLIDEKGPMYTSYLTLSRVSLVAAGVASLYGILLQPNLLDLQEVGSIQFFMSKPQDSFSSLSIWWGDVRACCAGIAFRLMFDSSSDSDSSVQIRVLKFMLPHIDTLEKIVLIVKELFRSRDTLPENRMLDIWKGQILEKAKGVLEEFDEQDNNAIASMSEFSVRSLDLEISALERMQFEESLISVLILYQGSDQFSITTCEQYVPIVAEILFRYVQSRSLFSNPHSKFVAKVVQSIGFAAYRNRFNPSAQIFYLGICFRLLCFLQVHFPKEVSDFKNAKPLILELDEDHPIEWRVPLHVLEDSYNDEFLQSVYWEAEYLTGQQRARKSNNVVKNLLPRLFTSLQKLAQRCYISCLRGVWRKIREIALESFFGENGLEQLLPVFNAIDDASFLFQSLGLPSSLRVRLVLQICENLQSILFNQLLASPDYRNPDFVAYLSNSISLTMDWAVRILEPDGVPADQIRHLFQLLIEASNLLLSGRVEASMIKQLSPSLTRSQLHALLSHLSSLDGASLSQIEKAGINKQQLELEPPSFSVPSLIIPAPDDVIRFGVFKLNSEEDMQSDSCPSIVVELVKEVLTFSKSH